MKKELKYIFLVLIFIPFMNVKADIILNINEKTPHHKEEIYWIAPLTDGRNSFNQYAATGYKTLNGEGVYLYTTALYETKIGSKTYPAICIDPGMKHGSEYKCSELDNDDIAGLFAANLDINTSTFITAVRIKSKRAHIQTNNPQSSFTFYDDAFSNFYEGSLSDNIVKGKVKEGGILKSAQTMANRTYTVTRNAGSTDFTYSIVGNSGKNFTVSITSSKIMTETPIIKCVNGCDSTDVVTHWIPGTNTGTAQFVLNTDTDLCAAKLQISYKSTDVDRKLYLCSAINSATDSVAVDEQRFLTYIPNDALGDEGVEIFSNSSGEGFTGNKSLEIQIPDGIKAGLCKKVCDCLIQESPVVDVHFCCSDSTTSEVKEPDIKNIFCVKKKNCGSVYDIDVPGAYDNKASTYDSEPYEINKYCKVYCTERVKVVIPGALKGYNGRYFKLEDDEGRVGPTISGSFSCRNIIKYDEWFNEYKKRIKTANDEYTKYQKAVAIRDGYKQAYEKAAKNSKQNVTVTVKYSGTCEGTDAAGTKHSESCDGSVDCSAEVNCARKLSDLTVKYYGAKDKYTNDKNDINNFSSHNLEKTEGSEKISGGCYTPTYTDTSTTHCKNYDTSKSVTLKKSISDWCSEYDSVNKKCTKYESKDLEGNGSYVSNNSGDKLPNNIQPTVDTERLKTDEQLVGNYNNAASDVVDHRKLLTDCDTFFESDVTNTLLNKKSIEPVVEFEWFFTYISVNSVIEKKVETIPFNNTTGDKCGLHKVCATDTPCAEAADYGIESPNYNKNSSHKEVSFRPLILKNPECNNDSEKCSGGVSETKIKNSQMQTESDIKVDQKYTSDNVFKYECNFEPTSLGNKYTVYPYGGFTTSNSTDIKAYQKHEGRLYVEYSTLHGDFETNWNLKKIGSTINHGAAGKFDKYFIGTNDCSGNDPNKGTPMLNCKLSVSKSLTKIRGCTSLATIFNNSSNWRNVCCDNSNCKVTTDDTLSFAFKIVDSTIIFPGTTRSGSENDYVKTDAPKGYSLTNDQHDNTELKSYAYNWFEDDIARRNLKTIEDCSGNEKEFDPDRITYKFNLNSNAINLIREYNRKTDSTFNAITRGNYEVGGEDTPGQKYKSEFITDFYNGKILISRTTKELNNNKYYRNPSTVRNDVRSKVVWAGTRKTSC